MENVVLKIGDKVIETKPLPFDTFVGLDPFRFSYAIHKKRITELKLSIREAAKAIGISAPTLSRVENYRTPDLQTYYLICKWLGVQMDSFFSLERIKYTSHAKNNTLY